MMLDDDWSIAMAVMTAPQTIQGGIQPEYIDELVLKQHPLLKSPASKLRWAQINLAALAQNIEQSCSVPSDLAVLDADLDAETGEYIYRIQTQPPMEDFAENFSHSVADIGKNIRSVYDKLAWACANDLRAVAKADEALANFPITNHPNDWAGIVKRQAMFKPEHWNFFEKFQPYRGVNGLADHWIGEYVHPITLASRLANDDKHAETWPVAMTASKFNFRRFEYEQGPIPGDAEGRTHPAFSWTGLDKAMEPGLEVLRVRILDAAEPHIDDAARAVPQVALPEGRIAVPTLERLYRFAHLLLSEFAREFPAP